MTSERMPRVRGVIDLQRANFEAMLEIYRALVVEIDENLELFEKHMDSHVASHAMGSVVKLVALVTKINANPRTFSAESVAQMYDFVVIIAGFVDMVTSGLEDLDAAVRDSAAATEELREMVSRPKQTTDQLEADVLAELDGSVLGWGKGPARGN